METSSNTDNSHTENGRQGKSTKVNITINIANQVMVGSSWCYYYIKSIPTQATHCEQVKKVQIYLLDLRYHLHISKLWFQSRLITMTFKCANVHKIRRQPLPAGWTHAAFKNLPWAWPQCWTRPWNDSKTESDLGELWVIFNSQQTYKNGNYAKRRSNSSRHSSLLTAWALKVSQK